MTDEQRNARVIWKHNKTQDWVKQNLTEADEGFVRWEARRIDASGSTQKARIAHNLPLEQKAKAGRAHQAKLEAKRAATKAKLAEVCLIEQASHEQLSSMTVLQLNSQIDKLRETDKTTQPKSKLRTKSAKITEIQTGLNRRNYFLASTDNSFERLDSSTAGMTTEDCSEEGDGLKDEEMYFGNEVAL